MPPVPHVPAMKSRHSLFDQHSHRSNRSFFIIIIIIININIMSSSSSSIMLQDD